MLSLRVSRDKRGYDHIYLLLEARRRGRVENRLLYCGRWPSPCRVGQLPFDDETRSLLERAHPDVPFDWGALLKTLQAALGVSRPPLSGPPLPPSRPRRPSAPASAPPYSPAGRPGGPPSSRPDGRRPGANEPTEPTEPVAHEYAAGQVVLVSADFEEPDPTFAEPGFAEPGGFVPVADEAATADAVVAVELHDEREDAPDDADTAESAEADTPDADTPNADTLASDSPRENEPEAVGTATSAARSDAASADPGAARPQRRRRRRGGRGRGKPPDLRQGSE